MSVALLALSVLYGELTALTERTKSCGKVLVGAGSGVIPRECVSWFRHLLGLWTHS